MKYFRERIGLSQVSLSDKSGISQASIARIESGKQRNLKRETMEKLADGLRIPLRTLMEPFSLLGEEEAHYSTAKGIPVLEMKDIDVTKGLGAAVKKADVSEPALSRDRNAFYLRVTKDLTVQPVIDEGDLILIEPGAESREGDMVLFLSLGERYLGKVYYPGDDLLILPLRQDLPPILLRKKERSSRSINVFRVGGIRK